MAGRTKATGAEPGRATAGRIEAGPTEAGRAEARRIRPRRSGRGWRELAFVFLVPKLHLGTHPLTKLNFETPRSESQVGRTKLSFEASGHSQVQLGNEATWERAT